MVARLFNLSKKAKRSSPPRVSERVYAVGDIHGRADLLDALHVKIIADLSHSTPAKATLVYLGDYVDRGPNSFGVLERLCGDPVAGVDRVFLKGNHEAMLLDFLADAASGMSWRQLGGLETILSYHVDIQSAMTRGGIAAIAEEFRRKFPASHRAFLQSLVTFTFLGDYFFCHAGVRPGIELESQSENDLLWIREPFLSSLQDHGKVIVHGHTPVAEPEVRSNRINIDTTAYLTHRLTCLVLEGEERRFLITDANDAKAG